MFWLLDDKKMSEDTIARFDRFHNRDRQTDKRTDRQTPHDGIGRTCIASHGKNLTVS